MLVRRAFRAIILSSGITSIACNAPDDASYAIQRLALDTLFNGREHARALVIWSSDSAGPVLESFLSKQSLRHKGSIDLTRLNPTLPTVAIDEASITRIFREHPDAWAEFFRRYPRSSGLVEISTVRFSSGNRVADLLVGRTCGPHCQNAWQIVAKRDTSDTWKVAELHWIRVPET